MELARRISGSVDDRLAAHRSNIESRVRECIAAALNVSVDGVVSHMSLVHDLGAESIDTLDLLYRLETEFGVAIPQRGLLQAAEALLAAVASPEGRFTPDALAAMNILHPEIPSETLAQCRVSSFPDCFTVETMIRLVAWRLCERDTLAASSSS